jgi:FkbM family methyltransferase
MLDIATFRTFALANMMEVEAILHEIYTAHCRGRTGFVMFDGGAHKAWHTLRMLALPGCAEVYAVEADPYMAKTCRGILEARAEGRHANIRFIQKALQRDPATTEIRWKSSTSHVGRSSIVADNPERNTIWGDNPDIYYRDEMKVEASTIDLILQNEDRELPFVKLDLEGADIMALFGASETLRLKRPVVAFENSIHAPKVHGFTIDEATAYFASVGYVPMNFVGDFIGTENWFGFFEAWAVPSEHVQWMKHELRRISREKIELARK